ncbi:MAG: MFS transporter, partial [Pseudomonas sp.]
MTSAAPPHTTPTLTAPVILLMSVATGLAVASNYYAQPLLHTISQQFSLSNATAGAIVTTAQLSYAVGLMLLVPLGDMFERRSLIVLMTLLSAGGLLISSFASSISMLLVGTALTGMLSVVAQILV